MLDDVLYFIKIRNFEVLIYPNKIKVLIPEENKYTKKYIDYIVKYCIQEGFCDTYEKGKNIAVEVHNSFY